MKRSKIYLQVNRETDIILQKTFFESKFEVKNHLSLEALVDDFTKELPMLLVVEVNKVDDERLEWITVLKRNKLLSAIPLVIITWKKDEQLLERIMKMAAYDIIFLPLPMPLLMKKITNAINTSQCINRFDQVILEKSKDTQEAQAVLIDGLATLAEYRDTDTGEHIKRTQNYVKALALALLSDGLFEKELSDDVIDMMFLSIPLHDIGKVGIRDDILLKPGKLTTEEFDTMKTHTTLGYNAIYRIKQKLAQNTFLQFAAEVAYTHHEKYDGSGYPRGLAGEEIPLIGRLMAIADVYDALICKRVYKEAMPHKEAVKIIREGAGTHFDPLLVHYFEKIKDQFENIALTYSDTQTSELVSNELSEYIKKGIIKKILIADDSRIIRTMLKNQLTAIGFDVDEAENGEIGLKKSLHNNYDMIISDVEMPFYTGYEIALEIQKKVSSRPLFIIMTASDYTTSVHELKSVGVDGLLLKPVEISRLTDKLKQIYMERKKETI